MADQTIEEKGEGFFAVYEFGVYDRNSVLAGQTKKQFLDGFNTLEEAQAKYPSAEQGYRSAHNSYGHLPGEDDPVAGGMFPDDIGYGRNGESDEDWY